jgi:hypothetical protein
MSIGVSKRDKVMVIHRPDAFCTTRLFKSRSVRTVAFQVTCHAGGIFFDASTVLDAKKIPPE